MRQNQALCVLVGPILYPVLSFMLLLLRYCCISNHMKPACYDGDCTAYTHRSSASKKGDCGGQNQWALRQYKSYSETYADAYTTTEKILLQVFCHVLQF